MAGADIRIRVRGRVPRIRIRETRIRTVVRITAPVDHRSHSLLPTILTCQLSASLPEWQGGRRMDYQSYYTKVDSINQRANCPA